MEKFIVAVVYLIVYVDVRLSVRMIRLLTNICLTTQADYFFVGL